ncbi:MAG: hypothetical protein KKB30_14065 [Proteobacteria bacterium]|nr:hypothetical protein [Pseudomonadota bacterium]MBU1715976.1 hypothetical protein [Pseudomonadota bacterium]
MRFFGVPILAAVAAGIFFPYAALSLMPFGFVFLFILMLLSGLTIEWRRVPSVLERPFVLLAGLFLMFVFFPLLQLLLARLLINDSQFIVGIVFGSLMPAALVAPLFTRELQGDEEFSFLLLVVSTLLVPLVAPLLLKLMTASILPVRVAPLMKIMLLLVTVPLFCSFLITEKLPKVRAAVLPYLGAGNAIALSLLIFILFGNAVGRLNVGYAGIGNIGGLLILAFFQDFGVLFLARFLSGRLFAARTANALFITLSMKNVAIATGILLFYDPRASLAPALVFVGHAGLFSFIPVARRYLRIKDK